MTRADFFVTGTDTGVGKTLIAAALLTALKDAGLRTVGMKPVAAGLVERSGRLVSEDVAMLLEASKVKAPRELVNPYSLRDPVAPNLAAAMEGVRIEAETIVDAFHSLQLYGEAVIVEGAGGFRVPLGDVFDGADLARMLGIPVVMVVGMRLGCVNHALLTAEAIVARGLELAGWVANRIDPQMALVEDNVAMLRARLGAPCLGVVPHLASPDFREAARSLDVQPLLAREAST